MELKINLHKNNKNRHYSFIPENRKIHLNAESLTTRPHLSSLTSDVDHGSDGTDQRFLADGEIIGNGKGTNMITTSQRIDLRH